MTRILVATRETAERSGGGLDPPERAWHNRGQTVLDGCDPEGDVVRFRQVGSG